MRVLRVAFGLAAAWVAAAAWAQGPPAAPEAPPPAAPEPAAEPAAAAPEPDAASPRVFRLRAVQLSGLDTDEFSAADFDGITVRIDRRPLDDDAEGLWVAVAASEPGADVTLAELTEVEGGRLVDGSVVRAVATAVLNVFNRAGVAAVRVTVPRESIASLDPASGSGVLLLQLQIGRVGGVVIRGAPEDGGEEQAAAEDGAEPIDPGDEVEVEDVVGRETTEVPQARLDRIGAMAPMTEGDLIRVREIDRFVEFLNRHPGRRVQAVLRPVPGGEPDLEFIVDEAKQWFAFAQVSNTGTEDTSDLRERFGFIHYNLTNADDILTLDFFTANFEDVFAGAVSYDRPFGFDPRLRWRFFGDGSTFTASDVGVAAIDFSGEAFGVGGEARWNFFQRGPLFVDLVGSLQFRQSTVDNDTTGVTGTGDFLVPSIGLDVEHTSNTTRSFATARLETNLDDLAGTEDDEIDELGRVADPQWWLFNSAIFHSFYLDPLLIDDWTPGRADSTLVHEVVLSAQGQFVFGDRRVPTTFTRTAGGLFTVRGYPESFVAADNVVILSAEYRFHVPRAFTPTEDPGSLFGRDFRYRPQNTPVGLLDWDLILRAFVDYAHTDANRAAAFEPSTDLLGAGVGIELLAKTNLSARVDFAWALNDAINASEEVDEGDFEVHFLVSLSY